MLESIVTQIEGVISRSSLVITYDFVHVQLSINTGYVEGTITFINNFDMVQNKKNHLYNSLSYWATIKVAPTGEIVGATLVVTLKL